MFSSFVKITTSNGEDRWVNLARVTRVTLSRDHGGEQAMTFCFDGNDKVTVHGSESADLDVIKRLIKQLDLVASTHSRAA